FTTHHAPFFYCHYYGLKVSSKLVAIHSSLIQAINDSTVSGIFVYTISSIHLAVGFGAAGVPLETRKVLLGHTTGDITTHYSAPELKELIEAVEKVST